MKKLILLTAASAIALSATAFAATPNTFNPWYAGVGVNYPATQRDGFSDSDNRNYKLHSKTMGYNVFVGKYYNKFLGVEIGINKFGSSTFRDDNDGDISKIKFENAMAYYLDLIGNLPIAYGFSAYLKAGGDYFSNGKIKISDPSASPPEQESFTVSKFTANYGIGLQYMYKNLGARLEYTNYLVDGVNIKTDIDYSDSIMKNMRDIISFNLMYIFN